MISVGCVLISVGCVLGSAPELGTCSSLYSHYCSYVYCYDDRYDCYDAARALMDVLVYVASHAEKIPNGDVLLLNRIR
jgi:hypothetical protein